MCCDGDKKKPQPVVVKEEKTEKLPEAKVLLVGASGVGKTCLINQYIKGVFTENQTLSTGAMNSNKEVEFNGKKLKLDIWDTAGQEVYGAQTRQFYRDSRIVIIVYSIISENTFNDVDEFIQTVKDNCDPDCKIILCGNKTDLEGQRQVPYEDLVEKANEARVKYFETTAKQNQTVRVMFEWAAKDCLASGMKISKRPNTVTL